MHIKMSIVIFIAFGKCCRYILKTTPEAGADCGNLARGTTGRRTDDNMNYLRFPLIWNIVKTRLVSFFFSSLSVGEILISISGFFLFSSNLFKKKKLFGEKRINKYHQFVKLSFCQRLCHFPERKRGDAEVYFGGGSIQKPVI